MQLTQYLLGFEIKEKSIKGKAFGGTGYFVYFVKEVD
jgi:hypothetical protein